VVKGDEVLLTTSVSSEQDVFALRRNAKTAAGAAGMEPQDQVRLATVLSELGRDLLRPQPLRARFSLRGPEPLTLVVVLSWSDPRTPGPESLAAVARLLPRVDYRPKGQEGKERGQVVIECRLPQRPEPVPVRAEHIRSALRAGADLGASMVEDLRAQTRDLMAALEESRAQQVELQRLNLELEQTNQGVVALYTELSEELEETNRGVVALYAELDEKSRLLREASEAKTRFWSNVSHELRTPLNSVIGLSRLMLDPGSDPLTTDQHRQVSLVSAAGNMLLVLVDELLDVAKAEAGRLESQPAPVDLRALLAQLRGLMLGAAPPTGTVLVIPEPGGPELAGLPVPVTDEVMLTRILRNLLSNGLKFTPDGEVRLSVREDGPSLQFTVSDTGVGIPADQQAKVFEEFYQVPGPHQRDRPGTGLGLPYARRLAELLGGGLSLESAPGRGTTVVLRLPVQPVPTPTTNPAPNPAPGLGPVEGVPPRRLGKVLSADDDPAFREAFRPVLEQLAERVVEVHEGARVVQAVRDERPDALLLDLQMPGTDGYAVLAALAADPELRGVPVVVVTAARPAPDAPERLGHARGVVSKDGVTARRLLDLLPDERPESQEGHSR
jgi:signal transduction histidine kinase